MITLNKVGGHNNLRNSEWFCLNKDVPNLPIEDVPNGSITHIIDYIDAGVNKDLVFDKENKKWKEVIPPSSGGGGEEITDYNKLINKPSINGVSLVGNKTDIDLQLPTLENIQQLEDGKANYTYKVIATDKVTQADAREILTFVDQYDGKLIEFLTNGDLPSKAVATGRVFTDKTGNAYLITYNLDGTITQWSKDSYEKKLVESKNFTTQTVQLDDFTIDVQGEPPYFATVYKAFNKPPKTSDYGNVFVFAYNTEKQIQIYQDMESGKNYKRLITGQPNQHSFGVWNKINSGIGEATLTKGEIFNNYGDEINRANKAIGEYSHAEGLRTLAYGNQSHAEGFGYPTESKGVLNIVSFENIGNNKNRHTHIKILVPKVDCVIEQDYDENDELIEKIVGIKFGEKIFNRYSVFEYNNKIYNVFDFVPQSDITLENQDIIIKINEVDTFNIGNTEITLIEQGAIGSTSHVEGGHTIATGQASHAEGFGSKVLYKTHQGDPIGAHAEGSNTIARGKASHAEGGSTLAEGKYSHAEGYQTIASGVDSHAEGAYTTASGKYSHAEGFGTTASGEQQHVQGQFNIEDSESKYAHIIGNGKFDDKYKLVRSNAHTVDWQGNGWYQSDVLCGGTDMDDPNAISLKRIASKIMDKEIILNSSTPQSTKQFRIMIDDSGNIKTEEIIK